ncbi:hypothetical protein, partial [Hyphomonas atlantica]|uniref:hypothetical protein n=1 Tax=Hyphomonas atlantica TaxID=1280948 RepID=UPI0032B16CD4
RPPDPIRRMFMAALIARVGRRNQALSGADRSHRPPPPPLLAEPVGESGEAIPIHFVQSAG